MGVVGGGRKRVVQCIYIDGASFELVTERAVYAGLGGSFR